MFQLKSHLHAGFDIVAGFARWLVLSCGAGVLIGLVAIAFHYGIRIATQLRSEEHTSELQSR